MTTFCKTRNSARAGFSLVEVALAMMVVSVGLLAVFGLFPAGLDQNQRSSADTQAGLFAEEALGGFMAIASQFPWDEWEAEDLEGAASPMWAETVEIINSSEMNLNRYVAKDVEGLVDYAIRYRLETGGAGDGSRFIRTVVWPGEFGSTTRLVFYTEVPYTGVLSDEEEDK